MCFWVAAEVFHDGGLAAPYEARNPVGAATELEPFLKDQMIKLYNPRSSPSPSIQCPRTFSAIEKSSGEGWILVQRQINANGGAIVFVDDFNAWVTGPTA